MSILLPAVDKRAGILENRGIHQGCPDKGLRFRWAIRNDEWQRGDPLNLIQFILA